MTDEQGATASQQGNRIKIISRYQSIIYLTHRRQKKADGHDWALSVSELMKCSGPSFGIVSQCVVFRSARCIATGVGY